MKLSAALRSPLSLGALGAGIALVLAGCGGGGTAKASASPTAAQSGSVTGYVNCLKSHGYTPSANFVQRLTHPPTTDANGDFGGGAGGGGGFFGRGGGGAGGGAGGGNTTRTTLDPAAAQARQQAMQACQAQAPAGFRGFGNPAANAARLTQLRAYASCLSDHGYPQLLQALPPAAASGQTTTTGGNGQGLRQAFAAINRSDPAFIAANQTCQALAPAGPGRGGAGTTTTVPGA